MTAVWCGCREGFHCRHEGECRQRHLKEARAERERRTLNMARKTNLPMRGGLGSGEREGQKIVKEEPNESTWTEGQG